MNIFTQFHTLVVESLKQLQQTGDLPTDLSMRRVSVEPPRDPAHGDLATNAAMALAKPAKMKPRDIAEKLAILLRQDPRIESVDIAGPGFLNLRLTVTVWQKLLRTVLQDPNGFGKSDLGEHKRINVEYVSANPTGPLHVGHTRGAVFGDALASLLAFAGYEVTREYYINDAGAQVDVLARSAYQRYRQAHGLPAELQEGLYPGDYLVPVGESLKAAFGDSLLNQAESDWLEPVKTHSIQAMMQLIQADLAALGITMDYYFSEKSLYGTNRIEEAIETLAKNNLIYEGVLEPPKGKTPEDWEAREQTLFRSTAFGDDVDRPIKKFDGSWTYFAPDIAYHYDKLCRNYDMLINIFGADHGGYVTRMKAAVHALSGKTGMLEIKLMQLVKLFRNNEPLKMSKRAGNFVTLRDLLDEVGPDATRFLMLTRKNDAPLDFDFTKALEQSKDNPVYYVQYAHARLCSTLRKGTEIWGDSSISDTALAQAALEKLSHSGELALIRKIAEWPRLIESAASAYEPHRLAFYLYDLAAILHSHWHIGNNHPELRFLREEDPETTLARLALGRAISATLASGLQILGVKPLKEMR